MRRAFVALLCGSLFVVLWVATAGAQVDPQYPPTTPRPTAGPEVVEAVRVPGARGALPVTGGSNTPSLVALGIAALVVGLVIVLAVRRRRALARGIA